MNPFEQDPLEVIGKLPSFGAILRRLLGHQLAIWLLLLALAVLR